MLPRCHAAASEGSEPHGQRTLDQRSTRTGGLYDTQTSTYITLADVKQLVIDQEESRSSMPNPAKI